MVLGQGFIHIEYKRKDFRKKKDVVLTEDWPLATG